MKPEYGDQTEDLDLLILGAQNGVFWGGVGVVDAYGNVLCTALEEDSLWCSVIHGV
jgi:hypothetical protein